MRTLAKCCLTGALMLFGAAATAGPMSTAGQFEVSPTGAATYSIPIAVPPGTAGIEPKLSLAYNSQSGNGLLGVGWNLSGLSVITRCPRTMAQDGVRGGVNYDLNDRYCLDGQRLMAISGTYGANSTEYRTERESFSKIVSYGTAGNGPAWFKVWTKAGQILEYGNTADSRIEAIKVSGSVATWPAATARVWAVDKISDTKGNYLAFSYTEDSTNGDFYPSRIDYTGNASTGFSPGASVQFIYETRPDSVAAYEAASIIKPTKRLVGIQANSGAALVNDYRLTYEVGATTSRSRLKTVKSCDATGVCLPTMTNASTDRGVTFASLMGGAITTGSFGAGSYNMYSGDFNGDGKTDMCVAYVGSSGFRVYVALGKGDGTFQSMTGGPIATGSFGDGSYRVFLGDFNGDGKTDVSIAYVGTSGFWVYTALGNGDGTFGPLVGGALTTGSFGNGSYSVFPGDFNGDGKMDMSIAYVGSSGFWIYTALGNGGGTFRPLDGGPITTGSFGDGSYHVFPGDFNGDGKTDMSIAYVGTSGFWVYTALGKGDGTFQSLVGGPIATGSFGNGSYSVFPGDFNGDGKTDMSIAYVGTSGFWVYTALGNGDGTFRSLAGGPITTGSFGDGSYSVFPGDFNGDGKTDMSIAYVGTSGFWTYLALGNGDGTFKSLVGGPIATGSFGAGSYKVFPGDFNGDGKTDMSIGYVGTSGFWVYTSLLPLGGADLLSSVTSALGTAVQVAYKPVTDTSVYTKGSGSTYPIVDLQAPFYVGSQVQSSNGIGGTVTTNYTYGGLKAEVGTGRGLLGFAWVQATQAQTGITTRTEYRQDWPYVGLPSLTKKTIASGGNAGVLSQTTYTYNCLNPQLGSNCTVAAGNRYFPYVSQSVESAWDLNGAALPTTTTTNVFDTYGNATQVTVSTSDGFSKITSNTYSNDTTNWYLGRLLRSQVQSTTP